MRRTAAWALMTLLRALAFHPRMPLPEPEVPRQSFAPVAPTAVMTPTLVPPQSAPQQAPTVPLPETTSQVLAARQQLQRVQEQPKQKRVNRQPLPARGR